MTTGACTEHTGPQSATVALRMCVARVCAFMYVACVASPLQADANGTNGGAPTSTPRDATGDSTAPQGGSSQAGLASELSELSAQVQALTSRSVTSGDLEGLKSRLVRLEALVGTHTNTHTHTHTHTSQVPSALRIMRARSGPRAGESVRSLYGAIPRVCVCVCVCVCSGCE